MFYLIEKKCLILFLKFKCRDRRGGGGGGGGGRRDDRGGGRGMLMKIF